MQTIHKQILDLPGRCLDPLHNGNGVLPYTPSESASHTLDNSDIGSDTGTVLCAHPIQQRQENSKSTIEISLKVSDSVETNAPGAMFVLMKCILVPLA